MKLACVRIGLLVLVTSGLALEGRGLAQTDNVEAARAYVNKATAAYALNHYAVAAENFEKAFELKADPALLYNAAQSYRLAGNKERALELYESYLRVYGSNKKYSRPDIEGHIQQLKEAIEHDKAAATSPPTTTVPMGSTAPDGPANSTQPAPVTPIAPTTTSAVPSAPAPAETSSPSAVLTQQSSGPSEPSKPLTSKPWFWVAIGGGVVAAVAVALAIGMSGTNPASASIGKVNGN